MGNRPGQHWQPHAWHLNPNHGLELGQMVVAKCCSCQKTGTPASRMDSTGCAYLKNLHGMSDEQFLQQWSVWRPPLPEYRRASEEICVSPGLMSRTLLLDAIRRIMAVCAEELAVIRGGGHGLFMSASMGLIDYAYSLNGNVGRCHFQLDRFTRQPIQHNLNKVFMSLEDWKKPLFTLCLLALRFLATPDVCALKLSAIVERGLACPQVQVTSFSFLVLLCADLMFRNSEVDAGTTPSARQTFWKCLEHWMDAYKEQALASAFTEPARFYWARTSGRPGCPKWLEENVEAHALNWYVAMLGSTLAVQLPHLPVFWDNFAPPVVDFWEGLSEEVWKILSLPENFGRRWQHIPALQGRPQLVANGQLLGGHLPCQLPGHTIYALEAAMDVELSKGAGHFANEAVNPADAAKPRRKLLSRYLERFAHFFSSQVFVRRCFEALNAEQRPELVGASNAMKELFKEYRRELDLSEDSLVEHCYKDDMFLELDLEATSNFLQWLGVLKGSQ